MHADGWEGVFPDVGCYFGRRFYGPEWTAGRLCAAAIRDYLKGADEVFKCPNVRSHPVATGIFPGR